LVKNNATLDTCEAHIMYASRLSKLYMNVSLKYKLLVLIRRYTNLSFKIK